MGDMERLPLDNRLPAPASSLPLPPVCPHILAEGVNFMAERQRRSWDAEELSWDAANNTQTCDLAGTDECLSAETEPPS